jgi:ferredoxin--NADP+ reductase
VLAAQGSDERMTGQYAVGWIKRGPSGVIGTNKPDAVETVEKLLEDIQAGQVWQPASTSDEAVINLLRERQPDFVTFDDWLVLDELEQERGRAINRPRVKFSRVDEMLNALAEQHGKPASLPDPAGD